MIRTAVTALASAVVLTMGANAADIYQKSSLKGEAAYMPAIGWSGFYAGLHAGSTFENALEFEGDDLEVTESFIAGVHLGYNWQTHGRIVFGVEGDIIWLDDEFTDGGQTQALSTYLASIRGRIGYGFDSTLVYATGGIAFLDWGPTFDGFNEDDPTAGFVVGAGIEHKITSNLSVGLEGLYYDFGKIDTVDDSNMERDLWTIRARLSYYLNRGDDDQLE